MFKAARNRLVDKEMLNKDDAPSYFIECLLYNVSDNLFASKLAPTYTGILDWLRTVKPQGLQVPERATGAVRSRAGTVVPEEGAGLRRGAAGVVGGRRLRLDLVLRDSQPPQNGNQGRPLGMPTGEVDGLLIDGIIGVSRIGDPMSQLPF